MNIAVCVKRVPDTKIRIDLEPEAPRPDPYDLIYEMNPNDRLALFESLRSRNRSGGQVTVLTFGTPHASFMLRQCLALGSDRAFLIAGTEETMRDADATASSLLMGMEVPDTKLVLCGDESIDEMRGEVGPRLAELLGFNLVSSVMKIEEVNEAGCWVRVKKSLGGGWAQVLECPIPAVLTFVPWSASRAVLTNSESFPERKLSEALDSLEKEITILQPPALSYHGLFQESGARDLGLSLARKRPGAVPYPDPLAPASQRMEAIYAWGSQGRAGGVTLQGPPDDVAQELLNILAERGHSLIPDSDRGRKCGR